MIVGIWGLTNSIHGVFVKHAGEIFWQPIRGNLHWRQGFMAMKPRRDLLGHLGHLRNSLGSDGAARQGISRWREIKYK